MSKKGFTLIELMIVIAIIAIIAAIAIPGLLAAQRASNERNASASMKTLTTAEADFRSNDRDGNRVNDFWTGDVFALYGLIPVAAGQTVLTSDTSATNIIKLVEPSVAGADGQSQLALYGHVDIATSIVNGSTKAGYVYRTFGAEASSTTVWPTLMNDTDGATTFYGSVHDRNRFAFMAVPETLSAGKLMFIVNEDNTIWKYNLPAGYTLTYVGVSTPAADSTTTTGATIGQTSLDLPVAVSTQQPIFPISPGSLGFSKMD